MNTLSTTISKVFGFSTSAVSDVFDASRTGAVISVVRNLFRSGLDHYYKAGAIAATTSTWSVSKVDNMNRIEQMFFKFQAFRGYPEEWPANGLTIEDCTAFMQLIADSGQGLLDKKITKTYFLKSVRVFDNLVCYLLRNDSYIDEY
jgi:hypothetical protein